MSLRTVLSQRSRGPSRERHSGQSRRIIGSTDVAPVHTAHRSETCRAVAGTMPRRSTLFRSLGCPFDGAMPHTQSRSVTFSWLSVPWCNAPPHTVACNWLTVRPTVQRPTGQQMAGRASNWDRKPPDSGAGKKKGGKLSNWGPPVAHADGAPGPGPGPGPWAGGRKRRSPPSDGRDRRWHG